MTLKATNLREQTDEELQNLYAETRRSLTDLRLKTGGGERAEQPLLLRTMRRDVARLKTVMKERGME